LLLIIGMVKKKKILLHLIKVGDSWSGNWTPHQSFTWRVQPLSFSGENSILFFMDIRLKTWENPEIRVASIGWWHNVATRLYFNGFPPSLKGVGFDSNGSPHVPLEMRLQFTKWSPFTTSLRLCRYFNIIWC
jgi:hypothetical protein